MVFYVVMCAIVPMGVSKVLNEKNESLLAFISRLGSGSSTNKNLFFVCLGASSIVILALPLSIPFFVIWVSANPVFALIGLLSLILIIAIVFVIYSILHRKNSSKYPCCLPLGRKLTVEQEAPPVGDEFQLGPIAT